jgi:hypothetical protein
MNLKSSLYVHTCVCTLISQISLMNMSSLAASSHHQLYSPGWALASSWGFIIIFFLRGEVVSLTPNPQPGGPGYPFLSGSSPLTCLAWEALPVAYATTSVALGIIWPHKPRYCAKVGIPSGGAASSMCFTSVLFQHIYRNHCLCYVCIYFVPGL